MSARQSGIWAEVLSWTGRLHHKEGSGVSFRLDYVTDRGWVAQFMAINHADSRARWHAAQAWKALSRHPHRPPPAVPLEAVQRFGRGELRQPVRILIEPDGRYWRVLSHEFDREPEMVS